LLLACHSLGSDSVHRDGVYAREKTFRSLRVWLAVFRHQLLAEPLLDLIVIDNPYSAEQTHASIRET
jgi:hypothetical protein